MLEMVRALSNVDLGSSAIDPIHEADNDWGAAGVTIRRLPHQRD